MLHRQPGRMCLFSEVDENHCERSLQAQYEGPGPGLGLGPEWAPMSLVATFCMGAWPSVGSVAAISRKDRLLAYMEAWKAQQGNLYNKGSWHCIHIRVWPLVRNPHECTSQSSKYDTTKSTKRVMKPRPGRFGGAIADDVVHYFPDLQTSSKMLGG